METLERTSTVYYVMLVNSATLALFKIHKGILSIFTIGWLLHLSNQAFNVHK